MAEHNGRRLISALVRGDREEIFQLINDPSTNVNVELGRVSPLRFCAESGDLSFLSSLLRRDDLQINQKHPTNMLSPIEFACSQGHEEFVRILLNDQRIDLQGKISGFSFLLDSLESLEAILSGSEGDISPADRARGIYFASLSGNTAAIKHLLAGEINEPQEFGGMVLRSSIYAACSRGNLEVANLLLKDGRLNPNIGGISPLLVACSKGYFDIVELLLRDPRIDPNEQSIQGFPLYVACKNDHKEAVSLLLKDPRIDPSTRTFEGYCCIRACCEGGSLELLNLLLEDGRFDPNIMTKKGTPFHVVCSLGKVDFINRLLKDPRVEPNQAISNGVTPFHLACKNGNIELVKTLLSSEKINPNELDASGISSLDYAVESRSKEVVKALLECKRYDSKLVRFSSFGAACFCGLLDVCKLMLEDKRIFQSKGARPNPIWRAATGGRSEVVKFLLQTKLFDPNEAHLTETPLIAACIHGNIETLKVLLKDDSVDRNKGRNGQTPLTVASLVSKLEVVRLLIEDGKADPNLGEDGNRPLMVAVKGGRLDIVKLLLSSPIPLDIKAGTLLQDALIESEKKGFEAISNLIKSYAEMPEKTRCLLQSDLEWDGEVFAMVILLGDGILRIRSSEHKSKFGRFLKVSKRLPLELQMLLCKAMLYKPEPFYLSKKTDVYLKRTLARFHS